jgi:hypothetical protein
MIHTTTKQQKKPEAQPGALPVSLKHYDFPEPIASPMIITMSMSS